MPLGFLHGALRIAGQTILSASVLVCGPYAWANEGPAIIADLVSEIEIDGDLSDWPEDARRHPLNEIAPNLPEPASEADGSAYFMAGYSVQSQALYLALHAQDDEILATRPDTALSGGLGNLPDGAVVYLDFGHESAFIEVSELSYLERSILAVGQELMPETSFTAARRLGETEAIYEWRIDLADLHTRHISLAALPEAHADRVIGLGIAYYDRDAGEDGSFIKWRPGPNDGVENRRLGDLFLLDEAWELTMVRGLAQWSGRDGESPPQFVHFEHTDLPDFIVHAVTDTAGHFQAYLPPGPYEAYASDSRTLRQLNPRQVIEVGSDPLSLEAPLLAQWPQIDLGALVPGLLEEHGVRALGLAVVENGEISFAKSFGRDASGRPATDETLFRIASITKPIATMAVLSLADEGDWDLDQTLATYWIDPDLEDDLRHLELTSRLALRHLTGLPNWRNGARLAFENDPGTRQNYSGEGFEWMRRALEAETGLSLQNIAEQHVFQPAGMTATSFVWRNEFDGLFAGEYFAAGDRISHYTGPEPNAAANVLSTPEDLARFALWVMNGGDISEALYAEMLRPNEDGLLDAEHVGSWSHGLGWIIHQSDGVTVLEHSGGQPGINTHLIIIPETRSALVVLTNSSAGWPLVRTIFDATLNRDGKLEQLRRVLYEPRDLD